ncbi:MAG: hypothetical protein KDD22_05955 [Bdellovibrionales bacterium]|nr:hypothetical protein [Bdellovibrionales bacterium]
MLSFKGILVLMVGSFCFSQKSNAQDQEFFNCATSMTPVCDSYGTPAELVGPFNFPYPPDQNLETPSPYYPNPPPGQTNGTVTYVWNCLFTSPAYPGTLNYYAGIIGSCSYNINSPTLFTLAMTVSKMSVYPAKTIDDNKVDVTVRVTSSNGANVSGKFIQFFSTPQEFSGGHDHSGGRPTGNFDYSGCTTGSDGTCSVTYFASEIGGIEKITATLAGNPPQQASKNINVQVPSLVDFEDLAGVLNGTLLRLTGQTSSHATGHFLNSDNSADVIGIAKDIYVRYQASVGFNDMSLLNGGLFDIGPPIGTFWRRPHGLHRVGKSVDIDHCAISVVTENTNQKGDCPVGYVKLSKIKIANACQKNNGYLINEGPIHCELF